MFESVQKYFAPKEGDVRIRDYIREVPSAWAKVGQDYLRGFSAVGTTITKAAGLKPGGLTEFEKGALGTEERPTATSYGKEIVGEKFANTKIGGVLTPAIGFGLGIADVFSGGGGSKASKGAISSFRKIASQADSATIKKMRNFIDTVRTGGVAEEKGALKFKDVMTADGNPLLIADESEQFFKEGMGTFDKYLKEGAFGDAANSGNLRPSKIADLFERVIEERKALPFHPVNIRRMTAAEDRRALYAKDNLDLRTIIYDQGELTDPTIRGLKQSQVQEARQAVSSSPSVPGTVDKIKKFLGSDIPNKEGGFVKIGTDTPKKDVVINTKHYTTNKVAQQAIEQAAEEIRPLAEARSGLRMNTKEIVDEAKDTWKTLEKVMGPEEANKLAVAFTSTRMQAVTLSEELATAAELGDSERVAKAMEGLLETVDVVNAFSSNGGFLLRSAAIDVGAKDALYIEEIGKLLRKAGFASKDISERIAKMKNVKDVKEIQKVYREFIDAPVKDWTNLLRYGSMLSSPLTHIINTSSNLLNGMLVRPLTKLVDGGFDFISHPINKEAREVFAGEAGAYLKGYVTSVGNAVRKFNDVWKGVEPIKQPDLARSVPLATEGAKGAAYNILSTPTRFLEAADRFFMELTTGAEMAALGYRTKQGVKVADMAADANKAAKYTTFRKELFSDEQGVVLNAVDSLTSLIEGARNSKNPLLYWASNLTAPFVHTVMNIVKQGIEYSPIGAATIVGAKNKREQLAKATIGAAVAMTTATYALSGRLTYQKPANKNERELWDKSGKQEYSIKIGDKWVQYSKLPPAISYPMALMASSMEAYRQKKIDDTTYDAIASGLAKSMLFYSDQSYFKGIGDIVAAITSDDPNKWSVAASNYPQQFVPFRALTGWLARLTDDTMRTIDDKANFAEKQLQLLALNIPGLRQEYGEPKLDSAGQPIPAKNPVRSAFMPFKTTDEDQKFSEFLNDYETYAKVNRDENRKSTLLRESAEEKYNEIMQIEDPEEKKLAIQTIAQENPELLKKVVAIGKERKGGITPEEMMIKNMTVVARAEYVKDKVASVESPAEKKAIIQHYVETGIMTKSVIEVLKQTQ